ncbi:serine hydrolase domain-containing protein [Ekhidna sp.]|uniref:serine hydrolase domain-containing protein n=1 Tax=Ekhidna sp. TaxID=2608089 RepID=UPI00329A2061
MKRMLQIFFAGTIIFQGELKGQAKADSLLETYYKKSEAVGIVAGYLTPSQNWSSSIGLKDKESNELLSTSSTIRLASIAKIMTAVAVMQLVEAKKIELESPINRYCPKVSDNHKHITVRQLLNHSGGIRGYKSNKERNNKVEYASLEDAYEIFKNDPLLFEPGSSFSYTTYGYTLLGLIIEKVSGVTYESYLKRNIWEPLNMNNTGVEKYDDIPESSSSLYHKSVKGKLKTPNYRTNLSDRLPGGGVYSSVNDILLFGKGILDGSLINSDSFDQMSENSGLKNEGNAYGLGLFLYGENPKYGNVVGHGGAQIGSSTQLMLLPDKNAVVFVGSNTSGISGDIFYLNFSLFGEACE